MQEEKREVVYTLRGMSTPVFVIIKRQTVARGCYISMGYRITDVSRHEADVGPE